ncbi:MAG: acetyltransferase [Candidatus Eremiobacteraeota bacterium]|nr:acetyltransferase [Candidatus Eremiobacteraeota bacterium]MCW5871902.1 acetyltransferase [Candidatus Eremiobacteraeota bacterium]
MVTPIVILGSGSHGIDILDSLLEANRIQERYRPLGFLDDRPAQASVHGFPILGGLAAVSDFDPQVQFVTAIGSPTSYRDKPALLDRLGIARERWASVIHPSSSVSQWAAIGRGCVILQQCTLSAGCRLGDQVVMLPGCRVSHDTEVSDYNTLATGVILSGFVEVERNCYLGAGSLVRERLRLGEGCLLGIGSVVVKSVAAGERVAGNPARPLKSSSS